MMINSLKHFWNSLKGNRTRIIATIIAILGVIETNYQIIPQEYQGYTLTAIAIIIIILRQITDTPPGKKERL